MSEINFDLTHLFENQQETSDSGEIGTVKGNIPEWIQGTIFTTGPGKFHFPETKFSVNHYFDGYAIICKLEISGNKVTLWKKYEQSDALKKATAAGKTVLTEFYTPPSPEVTPSGLSRFSIIPKISDNGHVNVFFFANRIYTTNGMLHFREIIPSDLSTGVKYDCNAFGLTGVTPHPLIDSDGTMYNLGTAVTATGSKQVIIKIPPVHPTENFDIALQKFETVSTIPTSNFLYFSIAHSFGMSDNHFVLIDQPFVINMRKTLRLMITGSPVATIDYTDWRPEELNQFVTIDKNSGQVRKQKIISLEPFFYFNMVNCYQENDHLIVDVVACPDISEFQKTLLKNIIAGNCCIEEASGILKRFVIPLNENAEVLRDTSGATAELGVDGTVTLIAASMSKKGLYLNAIINPKFKGKKYQFAFGTSVFFMNGQYGRRITKFDLLTGNESSWNSGGDYMVGEPIFIPNPNGIQEDDGVLVAGVFDVRKEGKSFVVFVCAITMLELARAEFQNAMAVYYHGLFVPSLF
ncbi:unnamed protein product [Allacma fusca]|uniref:Uncharacterized protein n=1 Tax=Allacma fusca TaxID=39272 RepID=A0A8J2KJ96_9HEXA|nr:unnamed protein product [Allacma fusca]